MSRLPYGKADPTAQTLGGCESNPLLNVVSNCTLVDIMTYNIIVIRQCHMLIIYIEFLSLSQNILIFRFKKKYHRYFNIKIHTLHKQQGQPVEHISIFNIPWQLEHFILLYSLSKRNAVTFLTHCFANILETTIARKFIQKSLNAAR